MTLKDCTKEELIFIIQRMSLFDKYYLETALNDLEFERVKKKLADAERWSQIADDCRTKYIGFLKRHEGRKLTDIPISEIKEAERLLKDAERADKEYNRLIKEVDSYGTKTHGK